MNLLKPYAYEFAEGKKFKWKGKTYTVINSFDEANDCDVMTVQQDGLMHHENFNPYAFVEPVDA